MRSNSGKGESRNNLHDPTLRDKERARGVSGEAIQGEKKVKGRAGRPSDRGKSP